MPHSREAPREALFPVVQHLSQVRLGFDQVDQSALVHRIGGHEFSGIRHAGLKLPRYLRR